MVFQDTPGLFVVGVRHHSPGCARLVAHTVRTVRPRHVLIEGPADMNARLDELLLGHALPVALFTSYRDAARNHASWTPFCEYSPEWVALTEGRAAGARVRFMDLPAWHEAFAGVRNRFADGERRCIGAVEALCTRLDIEGLDALWDHLFEGPLAPEALAARLGPYFEALREEDPVSPRDAAREAFMREHVEAALSDGGPVVVVTGGYHAPVLARVEARPGASFPEPPRAAGARTDLVPYSFRRLDSFTGYESGMPSPAWYQALWEHGPEAVGDRMLQAAVEALRARGQPVSAADLVAVDALARGLARLRGHAFPSRTDLLDALAAGLVKGALEAPLPWTGRGVPSADTDPLLAEVLRAFSGERRGRLSPSTPRPPLVGDVEETLARLGLVPGARPRRLRLALHEAPDLEKSRALHRLRVLQVPGFRREAGPALPTEAVLHEDWTLSAVEDRDSAVVEASAFGPTLAQAAAGRLEEALLGAEGDLGRLALLLAESLFVGAPALGERVLAQVTAGVGREPELTRLGTALAQLLSLWRHDVLLGSAGSAQLGAVVSAGFARGLWLLESVQGAAAPADAGQLRAVVALRDTIRHAGAALGLDAEAARGVLERRRDAEQAPPALRGAALGALWSLGQLADGGGEAEAAVRALRKAALPATLGDYLAGLFALGREQVVRTPALTGALDALLGDLPHDAFLVALPSLRLAFSFFPPAEKLAVARGVLALHNRDPGGARALVQARVDPQLVAAGSALEAKVDAVLARHGLGGVGGAA